MRAVLAVAVLFPRGAVAAGPRLAAVARPARERRGCHLQRARALVASRRHRLARGDRRLRHLFSRDRGRPRLRDNRHRSDSSTRARIALDRLVAVLAVAGIPALFAIGWNHRRAYALDSACTVTGRVLEGIDVAAFALLSIAVLGFGALMAIWPTAMDEGLNIVRDAGVVVARYLGRRQTNFSFIEWDEANRHNTWIISSALALGAFALPLLFLFRAHSVAQAVGAAVLLSGVALAVTYVPWAPAYGDRYPTGALIVFYSPLVALASWHLLRFVLSRLWDTGERERPPAAAAQVAGGLPMLLAMGLFRSPNLPSPARDGYQAYRLSGRHERGTDLAIRRVRNPSDPVGAEFGCHADSRRVR